MKRKAVCWLGIFILLTATTCGAEPVYDVSYSARIIPTKREAAVAVHVVQPDNFLRSLRFTIDPERHRDFKGDGTIEQGEDFVEWKPPRKGGVLRYTFRIDRLRDARSYDARCAANWAIFRGDNLIPPASATTRRRARSRAYLRLRVPEGWTAVTRYPATKNGRYLLKNPERGFVRPTGWIIAGSRIGVVRETVAGTRVTIAAPVGHGLRRLDILAMLRWTLPELRDILGKSSPRLLVVGAEDPMWRGGLSGPASMYIHANRPLLTPDTTSPLLHELLHTVLPPGASPQDDWIVEGLAERYGLELLVRSKTIGQARYKRAMARLAREGRGAGSLTAGEANGHVTSRAVKILGLLDSEISEATNGAKSLDDVVRVLVQKDEELSAASLRAVAEEVAGISFEGFFKRQGLRSTGR
ncbi:MAG: hypothetical protein Q8R92_14550 [Deltaproteobacteria bacterium]|nr:hypothetical protein [Deltaproteobacteria bacterium]